jgi:hypothetical protein
MITFLVLLAMVFQLTTNLWLIASALVADALLAVGAVFLGEYLEDLDRNR